MLKNNWIDHALRRNPWRNQRQTLTLAALGFVVALIIGALYLSQAAAIATTGRQLEDLINDRNRLEQQNEQLRAEIAALRSVPHLQQRARDLGFDLAAGGDLEYLVVDGYDPDYQDEPIILAVEPNAAALYDETFGGWLEEQFDSFSRQFNQ
jgi:hypothetical protein